MMDAAEAAQRLDRIGADGVDTESDHREADCVLLDFLRAAGFVLVVDAYTKCERRCSKTGWWYA